MAEHPHCIDVRPTKFLYLYMNTLVLSLVITSLANGVRRIMSSSFAYFNLLKFFIIVSCRSIVSGVILSGRVFGAIKSL